MNGIIKKIFSVKRVYEENKKLLNEVNKLKQEKEEISKDRDWAYNGCGVREAEIKILKENKEKLEQELLSLKNDKKTDENILQPNFEVKFIGGKLPKMIIGEESYSSGTTIYCWDDRMKINIGKYCSFAVNTCIIAGGEHYTDWVSTYPFIQLWEPDKLALLKKPRFKGNIEIGNDVWIASNVTILSGVKIGDGAVIGAGSVVVKDIPPYAIVGGNPCKVIRYRFDEQTIVKLLEIKWWKWSKEAIKERLQYYSDINEFINRYYNQEFE